ncbi:L-lysine exporter family protein LysE/ArgO [Pseudooceanicola antarcticus]|uniref:Amino acid transporter n=1 Tax=Pseudooceanicola antarcticus TaxID=1247613 RepID=A0A285IFI9_9RHOB|nr:LysE/ArgO family amino acid transporter [Pseudooceanicola antarcticus]PJE29106.1 amino acid transporter [Pseudooceanicola antarcticus]SNY46712.1 L-lysine exporter family protein LysE/ArgO [Pseudooceanicola antarcticus]
MGEAFWAGLGLGLSLIVAIGAQNAFVLRQGILRQHVGPVVLLCAASDAVLILAGVLGFGALSQALPWAVELMRLGGAAFLLVYGALALRSAWRGGQALEAAEAAARPLWQSLAISAALTWGNPHVYLDTVVLLGAVSADFADKRAFATGAICASFAFFVTLGYGARLLAPVFRRPLAWRCLDLSVALVMWSVALSLLWS